MNILPSDSQPNPISDRLKDSFEELIHEDPSDHLPFHAVCAWCKGPLPRRVVMPGADGVSHGICRPCASRHFGVNLPEVA